MQPLPPNPPGPPRPAESDAQETQAPRNPETGARAGVSEEETDENGGHGHASSSHVGPAHRSFRVRRPAISDRRKGYIEETP